jgi:hypothetical protein
MSMKDSHTTTYLFIPKYLLGRLSSQKCSSRAEAKEVKNPRAKKSQQVTEPKRSVSVTCLCLPSSASEIHSYCTGVVSPWEPPHSGWTGPKWGLGRLFLSKLVSGPYLCTPWNPWEPSRYSVPASPLSCSSPISSCVFFFHRYFLVSYQSIKTSVL